MSWLDDLLPNIPQTPANPQGSMWGDPTAMSAFGGLGAALLAGGTPMQGRGLGPGNALAMLIGSGMQGADAGAKMAQGYQNNNLANQSAGIDFANKQQVNPFIMQARLNTLKNLVNNQANPQANSNVPGGPVANYQSKEAAMLQAANTAYALTGDYKPVADAARSDFENNPELKTVDTPNGPMPLVDFLNAHNAKVSDTNLPTFSQTGQSLPFGVPTGGFQGGAYQGAAGAIPVNQQPSNGQQQPVVPPINASQLAVPQNPRDFAAMPPQNGSLASTTQQQNPQAKFMASDGKPLIPNIQNAVFHQPDPTYSPDFLPTPKGEIPTKNDMDIATKQNDLATKQYEGFGTLLNSLSNEKYYATRMASIYQQMQSPNAEAEWPEIAKSAYNLGLISDPKSVHDLASVQEAINTGAKSVLSNIKDTSAGLDANHPMRIFGSEVTANMETALQPGLTPEARYNSLMTSLGLINRNMEAINSYNSPEVGGLGNRLNGGKTMPPTQYVQQFIANHDASDYRDAAVKQIPPFAGMASKYNEGQTAINPKTGHVLTFRGGQWQ